MCFLQAVCGWLFHKLNYIFNLNINPIAIIIDTLKFISAILLFVSCLSYLLFPFFPFLVIDFWFISIVFWEQTLYSFCSLTFVKLCFLTQNVIYLGEYFILAWEKICIFLFLDGVVSRCQLYSINWWCCWVHLHPYWFSANWICSFLREGY